MRKDQQWWGGGSDERMRLNSLGAQKAKEAMLCTAERTIFLTVGTTREYQGEIKEIKTYDRPMVRE